MRLSHHHVQVSLKYFIKQLRWALIHPMFLMLTILGNVLLISCAVLFYVAESGVNPQVSSLIDGFWWAVVTMTTVGYGDIVPVTVFGKCVAVILMFSAGLCFFSFMALLSSAFVRIEVHELENEVERMRQGLDQLRKKMDSGA